MQLRQTRLLRTAGLLLFALSRTTVAAPDQPKQANDRVTSHALFDRGRELFIAGKLDEACPLFEESHRLSPGIGVLLHLGACLEKAGKISDAWAAFQEAADRAKAENDSKRESMARARANALQGKLSYLRVSVRESSGAAVVAAKAESMALELRRDGAIVPNAILGLEIPVDPGQHRIVVQAKGRSAVERLVTLSVAEHANVELELPPAEEMSPTRSEPTPRASTDPSTPTAGVKASADVTMNAGAASSFDRSSASGSALARAPQDTRSGATTNRAFAQQLLPSTSPRTTSTANPYAMWTAIGLGTVGIVTGSVAGLVAYTKMREARALCEGHPTNDCPESATTRQDQARFPATVSTIAFGVGAAGIAFAGGYWLLSRPKQTVVSGSLQPGVALISVHSRW